MTFPFENNEEKFYYKELTGIIGAISMNRRLKSVCLLITLRLIAENIIISIWEGGGVEWLLSVKLTMKSMILSQLMVVTDNVPFVIT